MNKQKQINYLDKIKIRWNFITALTSSGIFKRFARRFNIKVIWFSLKPSRIIKISRIMRSSEKFIGTNESLNLIEDSYKFT